MPTIINIQNADSKAQDIYVLQLQIRDATQKLTMPTLGKAFSPSSLSFYYVTNKYGTVVYLQYVHVQLYM